MINLFVTPIFVLLLLPRMGAKKVFLAGGIGVLIGQCLLTIASVPAIHTPNWLSLVAGVLIVLFGSGPQAGSFVLPNELSTFVTRATVLWTASIVFYSSATVVCLAVPWLIEICGGIAFVPWMVLFGISVCASSFCADAVVICVTVKLGFIL